MKNKILEKDGLVKGEGLVLVVDDEPIMRKIAVNVLKNSGYEVIAAEDGNQAIQRFKKHRKDIKAVLMDLLMPDKSGIDTYVEMKRIQPDIHVLLVSGAKKDKRIKQALRMGIKGFIEKPYTFPQLSRAVFDVIHGKNNFFVNK